MAVVAEMKKPNAKKEKEKKELTYFGKTPIIFIYFLNMGVFCYRSVAQFIHVYQWINDLI